MAYQPYPYGGYSPGPYYSGPVPDQLAQLRQNQQLQAMQLLPPQPQMPQPIPGQAVQPVQQMENGGIIWVQGEAGAKAYMVAPGNTVPLWDSEAQRIFLKSVDMSGMPSMRVLDYTEQGGAAQKPGPVPQIDLSNYITRDELDIILGERLKRPSRAPQKKEEADHE
ncbi:hypothetical protein D7X94_08745 [Acutalibacter sp. 1XD8-33]|uniref:hypothetical protein n=1 Tax=Acutalibacter sp. 1XD8-33 TaxID=2320081 RepID=UPI000EA29B31|nr:hypothetical protein [Acutalibacter sp. 1XD8-33]RKJ40223.1 hypothetical protein D7X94_08745 [Acutalibacter sp. 1XD8-33]